MMAAAKTKIVALTGAGVSSPSGLATFRDPDGIWSKYKMEEVATPEAWQNNPVRVLEFYNLRRLQLGSVHPNDAHLELAELEQDFEVVIVTQNVDDLHERAGSTQVLHLHGQLTQAKSSGDPVEIKDIGYTEIHLGDTDAYGSQLRPNVVWFGESVENLDKAADHFADADIIIVAGTSLAVYPAAALINYARPDAGRFIIDLNATVAPAGFALMQGSADTEMKKLAAQLRRSG